MFEADENTPLVSVGLVTWNSEAYLSACLAGLDAQSHANLELIVVDNASEDRSVELVGELRPGAEIVRHAENRGYCAAHNRAIDASTGAYYLALNPDVVLGERYIEILLRALEKRPECGSAMGKLWLPGEKDGGARVLDGTGLFIDRRRHQYLRGHGKVDRGQYEEAGEIFGADGAAPLYKREMLEDVRLFEQVFDEAFSNYMEDVDLAWRARLFGWKAWYEPGATAVHDRTFKPGERRPMPRWLRRMAVRNRYLMLMKNEAPETWRRDWLWIRLYDLQIWGYILLFEQSSLAALPRILRSRSGAQRWRDEIRARARASREERLSWFG